MSEKIRISTRNARFIPKKSHKPKVAKKQAPKAQVPSDPAKMTKAQRRSEKHRILEERKRQVQNLDAKLTSLQPKGSPKKPQRQKLQVGVPIAIGFFATDGGINPKMYKWLIPDDVDYRAAKFGQLMTVPTKDSTQKVIYAFTVKGNQVKSPSGRIEPASAIVGFADAMATSDQVAAVKIRVDEIRIKREEKLANNRSHYLQHKRRKEKRASLRRQIRRIENAPIWPEKS